MGENDRMPGGIYRESPPRVQAGEYCVLPQKRNAACSRNLEKIIFFYLPSKNFICTYLPVGLRAD